MLLRISTLAVARTSLPPGVLRLLSNPPTWRWWSSSSHPSTWRWRSPRSYLSTWRWRSPRSQGGGTRDVPFLPNFPFQILVLSTLPTLPVRYYQPVLTSTFSTSQYCQSVLPSTFSTSQYCQSVLIRTSTPPATRTSYQIPGTQAGRTPACTAELLSVSQDVYTTSYFCRLKDESTTNYYRLLDISATSSSRM